jgi:hypothetical protein
VDAGAFEEVPEVESTNKVPRIDAPLATAEVPRIEATLAAPVTTLPPLNTLPPPSGLPPLHSAPHVMPALQRPRKSPWPWVIVAALMAAGAGFGTWWLLDHQGSTGATQPAATVTVTPSSAPISADATPTVSQTPTDGTMPDQTASAALIGLLVDDLNHHKAFTDAYVELKAYCVPNGSTLPPGGAEQLAADVKTVQTFPKVRSSYVPRAEALAEQAGPKAAQLARDFAGLQPDLNAAADPGVKWAGTVEVHGYGCQAEAAPGLDAGPALNSRRAAWMNDFRGWVVGGDAALGATLKWFGANEIEHAI